MILQNLTIFQSEKSNPLFSAGYISYTLLFFKKLYEPLLK
ncbi:Uncharacterized protein dnm_077580 [Desulfonema magnum]|uniref:Uncharacterized protein n=1 Tax=Desulfonema magnum TaxID=45655 RepID=A0A975BTU7_9BACT|nr:Uncharacterized protein dnm_077580 [Desulfonema magnum]